MTGALFVTWIENPRLDDRFRLGSKAGCPSDKRSPQGKTAFVVQPSTLALCALFVRRTIGLFVSAKTVTQTWVSTHVTKHLCQINGCELNIRFTNHEAVTVNPL